MTHLVGIDCAAQDRNCGLALGAWDGWQVHVVEVRIGLTSVVPTLLGWLRDHEVALFAIDAPLGWPAPMGSSLESHRAGRPLGPTPDELFHRETDRVVRHLTGKRPMEVGADKIARAAHRAVKLIGELRAESGLALRLAWQPGVPPEPSVIEVYPATTLRSRGISDSGYKGKKEEALQRRTELVRELKNFARLPNEVGLLVDSDDALDAVVCLMSAADFLAGEVAVPENRERAEKEGWIWVRGSASGA